MSCLTCMPLTLQYCLSLLTVLATLLFCSPCLCLLAELPTSLLSLTPVCHAWVATCVPMRWSISQCCWALTGHQCLDSSTVEFRYHLLAHQSQSRPSVPQPQAQWMCKETVSWICLRETECSCQYQAELNEVWSNCFWVTSLNTIDCNYLAFALACNFKLLLLRC